VVDVLLDAQPYLRVAFALPTRLSRLRTKSNLGMQLRCRLPAFWGAPFSGVGHAHQAVRRSEAQATRHRGYLRLSAARPWPSASES
jgi:hypothetical protein